MSRTMFRDRRHAGEALAAEVAPVLAGRFDGPPRDGDVLGGTIVLGLPRGGVPVAAPVAARVRVPLDVLVVRKLGVPGHEELAMGAVAGGGVVVRNDDVVGGLGIDGAAVERVIAAESAEVERREARYRGDRPPLDLRDRVVVLVDDGLATGATMKAAVHATRAMAPRAIVVAVPVGADTTCAEFRQLADEVVCLQSPSDLRAVGLWYDDFTQTSDDEVRRLLEDRA